jgi:Ni,Fe-hydrogenase I large subunit
MSKRPTVAEPLARQPIEILRAIHSFAPSVACAAHVSDAEGEGLVQLKVC